MSSYRQILESFGLKITRETATELEMLCPFHEDHSPSFYVNKEGGAWICHAGRCGLHGSFDKLYKLLQNLISVSANYVPVAREEARPIDISLKFLIDRGFTAEMLDRWEIAYNEEVDAVEIPCSRPDGHFVGYILRMPEGERPKYRHPAGVPRTALAEEQVTILYDLTVRQICLCFDNDEAGAQATAIAAKVIPQNGMWLRSIRLPSCYKDIQEVPFVEVPKVFGSRHIHINGGDLIPPELDRWR